MNTDKIKFLPQTNTKGHKIIFNKSFFICGYLWLIIFVLSLLNKNLVVNFSSQI